MLTHSRKNIIRQPSKSKRHMKKIYLLMLGLTGIAGSLTPQTLNDYRTKSGTNYWDLASSWERFNGTTWVDATQAPDYDNATIITVRMYHEIVVRTTVHVDQTYVLGTIIVESAGSLRVRNGAAPNEPDLVFNMTGGAINSGELSKYHSGAEIQFNDYTFYRHARNGGELPEATWGVYSTCEITSVTDNMPSKLTQDFGSFYWNCLNQSQDLSMAGNFGNTLKDFEVMKTNGYYLRFSVSATSVNTINGNFKLHQDTKFQMSSGATSNQLYIKGNFLAESGTRFYISETSSGTHIMEVDGNFTLKGNYFYLSTGSSVVNLRIKGNFDMQSGFLLYDASATTGNIYFNGTATQYFSKTGGSINNKVNFTVNSGATLNLGEYVLGDYLYTTGTFTLQSGATLITSHSGGIASSGAGGCIQNNGTRTFNQGAHYQYMRNGAQVTGNGLPSTVSGSVAVGDQSNATNLTFTNSTSLSGVLYMVNGTLASTNLSYTSSGILEYSGGAPQTTGSNEWPSDIVPNLRINNTSGVTLNGSKTVSTNLNLMKGSLSIASNTLTLNGTITTGTGSLTGGAGSNITFGGSGSTTLPGVTSGLNNLTVNRSGAVITIGGGVQVNGTLTLTAGTISLGAGSITYGSSGMLAYNGTGSAQTTSSAEFPASSGPSGLIINKPSQVLNLHASRQINGSIFLDNGTLNLGANTLTLAGDFASTTGNMASSSGGLLVFAENAQGGTMPSASGLWALSIDRGAGVSLAGHVTIDNLLTLTTGNLLLGNRQLTINGGISVGSGGLTGSTGSTVVVGGTGSSTGLPSIETGALTLNRSSGISLLGDVTVHNLLTFTSGCLTIGEFTLYINGLITATDNGSLGNSLSKVQVNEMPALETLQFPNAELKELSITRYAGVLLSGNVTIHDKLALYAGNCQIGNSKTLTLNGELLESGGTLTSTRYSGLQIGGDEEAFILLLNELNDLTINRPLGVALGNSLQIYGTLTLGEGGISPGENDLTYAPGASLQYRGGAQQTITDAEWPTTSGPDNIIVYNPMGVKLHQSRTIDQGLTLTVGSFYIQSNTLTLNGYIYNNGGGLEGGTESSIEVGGGITQLPLTLPPVTLNNLTLNRGSGLFLGGELNLHGTLDIQNGDLQVGHHAITLRNPVSGNNHSLITGDASTLILEGNAPGMHFGPDENLRMVFLGNLYLRNTHPDGTLLKGNLYIQHGLLISEESKFTLDPEARADVNGHILNEAGTGGFLLLSSSSSDASLIHTNPGVTATVGRFMDATDWDDGEDGWHLLSSMVNKQGITGDWTPDDPGNAYDFYAWDEPQNLWLNQKVEENGITDFVLGRGYLVAYQSGDMRFFTGMLNTGFIDLDGLQHTIGSAYAGWHLIGNPYASALNWGHASWIKENVSPNAKIWVESMKSYRDITEDYNNIIPPMNGFMVYVDEGTTGKLMIPPTARQHPESAWLKSGPQASIVLAAVEEGGRSVQECIIREIPGSDEAFDSRWDAKFMAGFAPRFYSGAKGQPLSLNSFPVLHDSLVIPLFFKKNRAGKFSIRLIQTDNPYRKIYLTDLSNRRVTDLSNVKEYCFVSTDGDNPDRFRLHFLPRIVQNTAENEVRVYSDGGSIVVEGASAGRVVSVIAVSGMVVVSDKASGDGKMYISSQNLAQGLYLVRVEGPEETVCRKVFLP